MHILYKAELQPNGGKLSHFTIQLKFRFVVYVRMLLSFVSNQVL